MKRIKLTAALSFLIILCCNAQTVNDVPIADIDAEHIQIVGQQKLLSTKVKIDVEFGQQNKVLSGHDTRIKDENGYPMIFNSMIDALNFFSKHGYDFLQAYTVTVGSQNVYHFLMKKSS